MEHSFELPVLMAPNAPITQHYVGDWREPPSRLVAALKLTTQSKYVARDTYKAQRKLVISKH